MADHVNPTQSLAPGNSLTLPVVAAPKPALVKAGPAKIADTPPSQVQESWPATEFPQTPESVQTSEAAMEQLNSHLQQTTTDLKFQVDQSTGHTFFKIVNESTGKVVLQVPSEEMMAMARNLQKLDKQTGASGVLMNKEG